MCGQVPSQEKRRHTKPQLETEEHGEEQKTTLTCSKMYTHNTYVCILYVTPSVLTHRPFNGIWNDIKRRYPKYWSDIRDAFSIQVLASIIFIFFANITPAITFGGVLNDITEGELVREREGGRE